MRRGIANRNTHHRLVKSSRRLFTGRISPPTGGSGGSVGCPLTVGLRSKTRNFRAYGFMVRESRNRVFKSFTVTGSRDSLLSRVASAIVR